MSGKNAKSTNREQLVPVSKTSDADPAAALSMAEGKSELASPKGQLDVTHHGLHKFKRVCKFKCKLCDSVYSSRKAVNDHHKQNHDKCICNICGKKCNTLSTLAHHKYSHQDEKKHICRNCSERFTFSGQLKQHRFIHRRISHFGCDKCPK